MSAEEFLNRLEQAGLLKGKVLDSLRTQVAQAKTPIGAQTIADLLVNKGRLTGAQAQELLNPTASGSTETLSVDDSGLAPADDYGLAPAEPTPGLAQLTEEPVGLTPVDAGGLAPMNDPMGLTPMDAGDGLSPMGSGATLDPLSGVAPMDNLYGGDPLGDAMSMDSMQGGMMPGGQSAHGTFKGKKDRKNQWESPLWLLLGGVLLVLFLVGGWLAFVLLRGNATEMFAAAEKSYSAESYSESIERYTKFISSFPDDENASKAKVKRVLAQLRVPISGKGWDRALETAEKELPTVLDEESFSTEARPELRSLLPDIAEGFTQRAKDATSTDKMQEQIDLAEKAMKLVKEPAYIPTSERQNPAIAKRISTIDGDMRKVIREINKDKELKEAVAAITKAANDGKTVEAFDIRTNLLRNYPSLETDENLLNAVLIVSEKERDLVQAVTETIPGKTAERESKVSITSVVLANRIGKSVPGVKGRVVLILAGESVYGIDVETGGVLWRRFVGYETTYHPQGLISESGNDAIAIDGRYNDLLRLNTADNQLRWRLEVDERFADPVILRNRIFVATTSGRLLDVNPESGATAQHTKFPQPLNVGPGADEKSSFLYQPGLHSNLYILSANKLTCSEVYYLGHKEGSITVPPMLARGHILIAENAGSNYSLLHVLVSTDDGGRGLKLKPAQQPIRLNGHVILPLQMIGRQALVVTDRGEIHVFEIKLGEAAKPVVEVANETKSISQPMTCYALVDGSQLWTADQSFVKYEVQIASGELVTKHVKNKGDAFLAPPQFFTNAVIHTRQRRRLPGISVSAVDVNTGEPIWRTDLGVPQIGPPIVDSERSRVVSISAQGNLFQIGREAFAAKKLDQPTQRPSATELLLWFRHITKMDGGRLAFTMSNSPRLLSFDPKSDSDSLRLLMMEIPEGSPTTAPVFFAGGLLVPWDDGQVFLIDGQTGKPRALPFQPARQPGKTVQWQQATLVGDGKEFVIADDRQKIYLVAVKAQPQPHLAAVAQSNTPLNVISKLAAVGNTVYGVGRDETGDFLMAFNRASLVTNKETPLDGRVTWGPTLIDDVVFLTTDSDKLLCLESDSKIRWTADLKSGGLAGPPLRVDDDYVLVSQRGLVSRIASATGEEIARIETNQPFGSAPVALAGKLWLYGSDGSLHLLGMDQFKAVQQSVGPASQ